MNLRKCEISTQIEYLPGFPDWVEPLEKALENPMINEWVYVLHDKDIDEEGTLKAPHVHVYLNFNDSYNVTTIAALFGVPTSFVERIKMTYKAGKKTYTDFYGALSYATHKNAPEKHQYDESEVVAKKGFDWVAKRDEALTKKRQQKHLGAVLTAIENGEIAECDVWKFVTAQEYRENKREIDLTCEYAAQKKKSVHDRRLTVAYIFGEPGSGKTSFAKKYCENNNLSYCISGGSRDPFQDYNGQAVLILDDLRAENQNVEELLKILDNNTKSSMTARYRDKWPEMQKIFITSPHPMEVFFSKLQNARQEPIDQFKRRCQELVQMSKEEIRFFIYNHDTKEYDEVCKYRNPMRDMFRPNPEKEFLEIQNMIQGFGLREEDRLK